MLIKTRRDKHGDWCFLETFEKYRHYEEGYVRALVAVTAEGELSRVFVHRGEEFIPLEEIDATVGIDKYIKAKKPFYSKVKGGYVVLLQARVNYVTKEYIPEKSIFEVYVVNLDLVKNGNFNIEEGLPFKQLLEVPKEFADLVEEPLRILGESFGDREKFFRSRLKK